jgi:predicted Zn-dependent protease
MADENSKVKTSADFYLEKLREMVKTTPDSKLFLTLAEELRKRDESEEAMAVLTAGVKANPAFVAARLTLGRWYLRDKRYPEARKEFADVLGLAPGDKFALRYIKEVETCMGNVKGAKVVKRLNEFLEGIERAFPDEQMQQAAGSKR